MAMTAGEPMPAKKATKKAKPKPRAAARAPAADQDLRGVVEQLAVLTAANNLMAQTAFLSLERMRISSEVVDESISNEFGNELFQACERLVDQSDGLVLQVLDDLGLEGARADTVRSLVGLRRRFKDRAARKPVEQRRLVESLERMYR